MNPPVSDSPISVRRTLSFAEFILGVIRFLPRLPAFVAHGLKLISLARKRNVSFWTAFRKAVTKYRDRPAVKFEGKSMSYAELEREAEKVARRFVEVGIRQGDIIYLLMESRPELVIVFLALSRIGASGAFLHPKLVGVSLERALSTLDAKGIVLGEECLESFSKVAVYPSDVSKLRFFVSDGCGSATPPDFIDLFSFSSCTATLPTTVPAIAGKDTAAFLFTSGTSGFPKAVAISHRRMLMSGLWFGRVLLNVRSSDTIFCPLPLYHTLGIATALPATIAKGASLAFVRRFSAKRLVSELQEMHATVLLYIGEILSYALRTPEGISDRTLSVRTLLGSGLRPHLWSEVKRRFGVQRILEIYSSTEAKGMFSNLLNIDRTVGVSFDSFAMVKFDPETGRPALNDRGRAERVSRGQVGLLLFEPSRSQKGRPGAWAKGETDDPMLKDVFRKGDVWFNTGDLVQRLGYGHAAFIDRIGDTFRWKGEMVSAREVESEMMSFTDVEDAVVAGIEIPFSDGRAGMALIVTKHFHEQFNLKGLAEHLLGTLPRHAVPVFIKITSRLPLTETYKKKKAALKQNGYRRTASDESIFVLKAGQSAYFEVTDKLEREIEQGKIRL